MNKNGVIAVVVVVAAIVLLGLWAMRSGPGGTAGQDCAAPPNVATTLTYTKERDRATLNWSAPSTGDAVTTYLIEAGSKPGLNDQGTFIVPGSATTFERQGPPGTYHVRVFARNACGTSPPSSEIAITLP